MFVERMRAAIAAAGVPAQCDVLARELWRAHGEGALDDGAAQDLAERLDLRRQAMRTRVEPVGASLAKASVFPVRREPRSPDRIASRDRRRLLAASGPLPPALAARFTTGQLAVLKIVGEEVARGGACELCLDAIAARAGVCRRLAQIAIRLAEGDGLLMVKARPYRGRKSDTNVIRILSREWMAWLAKRRTALNPTPKSSAIPTPSAPLGAKRFTPRVERDRSCGLSGRGKRRKAAEGQRAISTVLPVLIRER